MADDQKRRSPDLAGSDVAIAWAGESEDNIAKAAAILSDYMGLPSSHFQWDAAAGVLRCSDEAFELAKSLSLVIRPAGGHS